MRILVTGLKGFTGQYIKPALENAGHDVIGLQSNLMDRSSLFSEIKKSSIESVIHLAGISFVESQNVNAIYEINLIGTKNLLESLVKCSSNLHSILLASSANVYGNQEQGILSENIIPKPANHYAVSKFAMENMAKLWMKELPLFITRPFNYTGVGQNECFIIPKIVNAFRKKQDNITLGNLDVWREFMDVRSVVDIYRQLLEISPKNNIINVCEGNVYSLHEIIRLCVQITGHKINIYESKEFIRRNEVKVLRGDNSLLKTVISNWNTKTLKETLSWMLLNITHPTKLSI